MQQQYNTHNRGLEPQSGGFSLVEILVALSLLGVGLLGSLAYQIKAQQLTAANLQQQQACQIVQDVANRMTRNPAALESKAFESIRIAADYNCAQSISACATTSSGIATNCTALALAAFDLHDAACQGTSRKSLQALPDAELNILCKTGTSCAALFQYQIDLRWKTKNSFCTANDGCLEESHCTLDLSL